MIVKILPLDTAGADVLLDRAAIEQNGLAIELGMDPVDRLAVSSTAYFLWQKEVLRRQNLRGAAA